eukprot:scaffold151260_cov47-Attheya_sp.AAC.2
MTNVDNPPRVHPIFSNIADRCNWDPSHRFGSKGALRQPKKRTLLPTLPLGDLILIATKNCHYYFF